MTVHWLSIIDGIANIISFFIQLHSWGNKFKFISIILNNANTTVSVPGPCMTLLKI